MKKNLNLFIKVDQFEKSRIKHNAEINGYSSISDYIRNLALNQKKAIEDKILENNTKIEETLEKLEQINQKITKIKNKQEEILTNLFQ